MNDLSDKNYVDLRLDNETIQLNIEYLEGIGKFADFHEEILADVLSTFLHTEQEIDLVYGLDFDIIYTYANPLSRDALHSNLVQHIIDNSPYQFTLLPGTVIELFQYIISTGVKIEDAQKVVDQLKKGDVSKETRDAARELIRSSQYENLTLGSNGNNMKVSLNEIACALVDVVKLEYEYSLYRISELLNHPKLVPLDKIFHRDKNTNCYYHEEIKEAVKIELSNIRKGSKYVHSNINDAYNIATIVNHALLEGKAFRENPKEYKGCSLRLLTNTPAIFSLNVKNYEDTIGKLTLGEYESLKKGIQHPYAITHCFEASYLISISNECNNDQNKARKLAGENHACMLGLKAGYFAAMNEYHDCLHPQTKTAEKQNNILAPEEIKTKRKHIIPRSSFYITDLKEPKAYEYCKRLFTSQWFNTVRNLMAMNKYEIMSKRSYIEQGERKEENWNQDTWFIKENSFNKIIDHLINDTSFFQKSDLMKMVCIKTEIEKEENLTDKLKKNILKLYGIVSVFPNHEKKIVIRNEKIPEKAEDIFTFWYTQGYYYMFWPVYISEQDVLDCVNHFFGCAEANGIIRPLFKRGILSVVFNCADSHEMLCELPLQIDLDINEYRQMVLRLQTDEKNKNAMPMCFICETDQFNIKFDMFNDDGKQGVFIRFRNKVLFERLFELFKITSQWAKSWHFSSELCYYILKNISGRLKEWNT